MSALHGTRTCQYGTVHGRCRCIDSTVIKVQCPTPRECREKEYEPKHRKDTDSET